MIIYHEYDFLESKLEYYLNISTYKKCNFIYLKSKQLQN